MIQLLFNCRAEVIWIIRLRKADRDSKKKMISEMCPCCTKRMIRKSYMFSDDELQRELALFDEHIDHLFTEVDINSVL